MRFSAVNHDRGANRPRERPRARTRARPQGHAASQQVQQVQTEGNEYIKIHAAQQQRLIATTTPPTTTTTAAATTTAQSADEDLDYGFIRPPSFRPAQPVHPVDSRFQAPVTYRPALTEVLLRAVA